MSTLKKKNLLLAGFVVLTVIFGSLYTFELVKGPTSTTITSSTTFTTTAITTTLSNITTTVTETETVAHYITNQFFRTTSLTTPLTTSFRDYNVPFTIPEGFVVVSSWVVENGILLNLTCTPFFKVGDTFILFITMENVNNTSHISTLESLGSFNVTIYNSKSHAVYWNSDIYAEGPTGPPPPNLPIGAKWTRISEWDTETNWPNKLGPGIPPAKPAPGNYTLVAQGTYFNIDLNKIEQVELQLPLIIA